MYGYFILCNFSSYILILYIIRAKSRMLFVFLALSVCSCRWNVLFTILQTKASRRKDPERNYIWINRCNAALPSLLLQGGWGALFKRCVVALLWISTCDCLGCEYVSSASTGLSLSGTNNPAAFVLELPLSRVARVTHLLWLWATFSVSSETSITSTGHLKRCFVWIVIAFLKAKSPAGSARYQSRLYFCHTHLTINL